MTLPGWLDPLLDPSEQRSLDEWAIEERGVAGIDLMERAGAGLADVVAELVPAGPISVVCGKGNNGGDGLVAARLLRERGRDVEVLLLGAGEELRGDARQNLERLPGEAPKQFSAAALSGASGIIDAILGTGFSGQPRDPAAAAIEAINDVPRDVVTVACDIPSGVDGANGEVAGAAVRARATVTFHAAKPGLWISPGKDLAGDVRVVDIGIPPGGPAAPTIGLISSRAVDGIPRRGRESTKFAAGSVLVCGGSTGLTGAPSMASESAMRAGAGYVTAFVPGSLGAIFEGRLLEVMTVPLPDLGGSLEPEGAQTVLDRLARSGSLVLGPGIGRQDGAFELARNLAREADIPVLLDADGLNAHAGALDSLSRRTAGTVLTPHAGELARLLDSDSGVIAARRLGSARRAAEAADAVMVLKGDDTIVAEPAGRVGINRGGAAALATAGTGDVLSGVIGAFLAKRMDPFHAACAGVLVHAWAGRLAARDIGTEGVIARDVIEALPHALTALNRERGR